MNHIFTTLLLSRQQKSNTDFISYPQIMLDCLNVFRKQYPTNFESTHLLLGQLLTNHYKINHSSLRAVVKCNQVSKRAIERCHNDTHDSVTVSYNNLNNNLTYNLVTIDKLFVENESKLKPKQRDLVKYWTDSYIKAENESFDSNRIKKYIVVWLMLGQTQKLWDDFQNGLRSPIEKGWTKGTS